MGKRNPKKQRPNILKRFYVWKYSGLLTVFPTIGIIAVVFLAYQSQLEFYDNFTCDGLVVYKINNKPLGQNPTYNELTDKSKEKYDIILNQCKGDFGVWTYNGNPVLDSDHQKILKNEMVATEQGSLVAVHGNFGE
jgi:hypothetical protein